MGCKCRQRKNIHKFFTGEDSEKSGLLARIIQGLAFLAVLTIVLPFALIYLYFSYVINGNFVIKVPNFVNKLKMS